jgi:hypothetical protein
MPPVNKKLENPVNAVVTIRTISRTLASEVELREPGNMIAANRVISATKRIGTIIESQSGICGGFIFEASPT